MANLTTAKTFREYAAIEGVNHPPIHPAFSHAQPNGDAISPAGALVDGVIVPPVFTADPGTELLSTAGHGLLAGTPVRFTSTTTLPAGLSAATTYYVIASGLTADVFKVSATLAGSAVNITDAGTGTHSWSRYLTAEEQAEMTQWLNNGRRDVDIILPGSILARNAWLAYEIDPRHLAWVIDDHLQKHWQWHWRSADHAGAAKEVSPPAASETAAIPDPPPPSPADRLVD